MKKLAMTLFALFSLLATGCSEKKAEKKEEQKLVDLRSSVLSTSYQFTSENGVKLAVDRYKDGRINERTAHGMMGLLWLAKNKPQLACLEADTFSELNKGRPDNLSHAIRTVAFSKMNWNDLSAKEYAKTKEYMAEKKGSADKNSKDHKMALVGQVLVGLYQRDNSIATESAKDLDELGGGERMKLLVDIAIKAREGNIEPVKQKIDELLKKPGLSEQKKAMLADFHKILTQQKPGKMSEEDIEKLMNTLANSVVTDMFKGSKLGAILNKL